MNNKQLIAEARELCKLYERQNDIPPSMLKKARELANALEKAEKQIPRWIPVDEDSDELPYDDGSQQDVLCYFADGEIQTFNLYEIREWNKSRRDTGKNGDVATHYMPLPKGAEDKE